MWSEIGKWCLDVAKYVLTAGILSAVFADMRNGAGMYFVAGFIFIIFAVSGIILLWYSKKIKKEEEKLCKD